jgi:hypothetical protein
MDFDVGGDGGGDGGDDRWSEIVSVDDNDGLAP